MLFMGKSTISMAIIAFCQRLPGRVFISMPLPAPEIKDQSPEVSLRSANCAQGAQF